MSDAVDPQAVSRQLVPWGEPEGSSIVEPGQVGSRAAAGFAPEVHCGAGGRRFVPQALGDGGRFYRKGNNFRGSLVQRSPKLFFPVILQPRVCVNAVNKL